MHIVVGYIPPQIGRESITSALRSSSFEKSWSQNYLRRYIVGVGPGRATGVNFGGQDIRSEQLGFSYDVGIFSPEAFALNGNSTGVHYSPLIVGRIATYIGDPESKTYTIEHKVNYFGERDGFTIALAGSYQGRTDLFVSNKAFGIDWLWNRGSLNFDGEWTFFNRSGESEHQNFDVESNSGYGRIGYNLYLNGKSYIEPVFMYTKFNGPMDFASQYNSASVRSFSGRDQIIELGFNYHVNPNLKLSLFYTMNSGDMGEALDGINFNNYFDQSGIGAIKRGNLIGLGIVGIF